MSGQNTDKRIVTEQGPRRKSEKAPNMILFQGSRGCGTGYSPMIFTSTRFFLRPSNSP